MDLHYSQTFYYITVRPFIVSLPYGFTLFSNYRLTFEFRVDSFTTLWIYTILKRWIQAIYIVHRFTTLWIYTILKPADAYLAKQLGFTTLWIYTILKLCKLSVAAMLCFTTLWIYTILKPQISCAHYTAQGKSTRSSTIVLWRNGIVKGAQIPIQHIEFGAHIYARRCLAL